MRLAAVVLCLAVSGSSAWAAMDLTNLPETCKSTLDTIKTDKTRFAAYSGAMMRARKSKNMPDFCAAAKGTLALIVGESDQVDQCLGELAVDKSVTPDLVGQFTEVRTYFHKMLDAAKVPANDHMHCGLAE